MPPAAKPKTTPNAKSAPRAPAPTTSAGEIVLLTGAESSRKTREAHRIAEQAADKDFADFDIDLLDGNTAAAERILSGVATAPFGVGKRVVLVRDTQQMDEAEQKKLAAGLARIPASGLLILHTGTPIVEDGKTKKGSVATTELVNAVKKLGKVVEFALPAAGDLREWLINHARHIGKTLAPDALAVFAQLPADDVRRVQTELEKAAAHAGDSPTITGADVEATLSRSPDDVIFKLCDAVGMRKTPEALGHVSTLFRGGGRPDAVAPRALVLLARQMRLLTQFRYLGEQRMAGRGARSVTPEVMAYLPGDGAGGMLTNPRMSWMADKYVAQARNFTFAELMERMEKLLQADLVLKGVAPGGDSPQAVMQRLIVELC